ncbi:MAG: choice-of-anchor D domain-containing protein, partial [Candidatus Acidiferrales bacterium]
TPTALGGRSATITVADNASGSPHTAGVTGTGVFPQATPTPSPLPFANQIQGTTSVPLTVTLTNGGTDVLHITTVALGGANPADFAIATGTTCTNGSTVAAGNTCIVNLTFTPATANPFTATLTFTDDASPTTQTVNLSGTGVTPPTATLSAGSISFGNQRVNTASAAQSVTITNNGGAPLSVTSIAITGTNASEFAFASPATTCPTSVSGQVAPAASCTLSVTFDPAAANARSASITITVTGIANPTPVTLSGTGIAPVATPAGTGAFGNQEVSTSSAALNGTLNNTGTDVLHITAVAITGTNASDFSIVAAGTSCATGLPAPVSVAAAANCTWSVKFTPTALGSRTASLTFTDDSGATAGSTQSIALTGMGTAPVVQLAPTTVSFPAQAVSTTSAPMNGTLTNTGTTTLHLATVTISGTNSGDFAIASGGTSCTNGSTVAPTNGTCTWSVTFTPSAAGTRTATLTFTDDNNGVAGSTQTVALTGITPPAATLSPSTPIAFGNQGVGTTSSASTITVSNPGGSTLHIATVAIGGTNAADFAVATTGTTCTNGSTVAPAASCTINLTFTPAAAGSRGPATLTVTDDASPATQTVSLSGTGISFSLSISTPPVPETAGTPITATIQLTPGTGGFPNAVTFSASNLPPDTTASFSQTMLTPGTATVTTVLTLTTTVRSGGNSSSIPPSHTPVSGGWIATALLALLAMLTMRRGFRMQKFAYLPLAVLLLSAAIITGCTTAPTGTPAGNYTVNVKATSGSYSQSTPVSITVK